MTVGKLYRMSKRGIRSNGIPYYPEPKTKSKIELLKFRKGFSEILMHVGFWKPDDDNYFVLLLAGEKTYHTWLRESYMDKWLEEL